MVGIEETIPPAALSNFVVEVCLHRLLLAFQSVPSLWSDILNADGNAYNHRGAGP